jgi:nicotinate-nucleotide pyrophosphorylase (carboxylating)
MTEEMLIRQALEEDLGDGDHSSLATIPAGACGKVRLLVKDEGVLAGMDTARKVYALTDPQIIFKPVMSDGDRITRGDVAFTASGSSISLLSAERTVLNFMQRMSGIATRTRQYVDAVAGTGAIILDTRKTTPNMRIFEKYAVKAGGAQNHRFGLYDMIMVKDNHVDFAGGIEKAIRACQHYLNQSGRNLRIEIEVRNLDELHQVLDCGGIHRIMLDNFSPADLKTAVEIIARAYETEASGGITLDTIRPYAETGVNYISVGALTHQIKSLDLSLKAY